MIEFDATIIVQMINFSIFLLIMRAILFKPLVKQIQERRDYISDHEKKVTDGLAKLEAAEKNHKLQLDDARKRAQDILNKNISSAEEEKHKIISEALAETKKVFEDFKLELEAETQKTRAALSSDIDILAESIVKKVMSTSADEKVAV